MREPADNGIMLKNHHTKDEESAPMRNIYCGIADIRKRVFAEVAKLAYEGGDYRRIDKLP